MREKLISAFFKTEYTNDTGFHLKLRKAFNLYFHIFQKPDSNENTHSYIIKLHPRANQL